MPEITITLPPEVLDELVTEITSRVLAELARADAGDTYLTVEEAARLMRCSTQRIYDLRSANVLPRHGDGRRALVSRADIDRYIQTAAGCPAALLGRAA